MGSGCTCQNTMIVQKGDRVRWQRMGNFTFLVHDRLVSNNGCKRTPAWETSSTRQQILQKRQEFWQTRIDGNPQAWMSLKAACDQPDPKMAQAIVLAAGLSLVNGLISYTLDSTQHRYSIPPYVLNEPLRYGKGEPDPKLPKNYKPKNVRVVFRSALFSDFIFEGQTSMIVGELKRMYLEENPNERKMRFFFNGKEMKDEFTIGHYGVEDGLVVQVILAQPISSDNIE